MTAVAARGQALLDESVWRFLHPGLRQEVAGVYREGDDLVVVLASGRLLRIAGCFTEVDAEIETCAAEVSIEAQPSAAGATVIAGGPVALGRLDEMFGGQGDPYRGDLLPIAEWLGLSDQELGAIVLIITYLVERTSVFGGDDDEDGPPSEQEIVSDLGLEGATDISAEIAVKSFTALFGEEALAALTENPEELEDEDKVPIQGLLHIVNAYVRSETVLEDEVMYLDDRVVLGLDLTGDGSADVAHTWILGGENDDQLKVEIDIGATEEFDATFLLNPALQTGSQIVAEVDFDRDGTVDATLYDNDGTLHAPLRFDRVAFDRDDVIEVREVDLAYLAGIKEVALAENGVTEISVTAAQLEALGAGQGDDYVLVIEGDSNDIVFVNDGTVERLPRQDTANFRAYSVPGVTIQVDKDITFGISEGEWRDLSLMRQLSVVVAPPGASQHVAVQVAEQVLRAYGVLYGKNEIDGLREDPGGADAAHTERLQGMANMVNAYLNSGYEPTMTERQDRVTFDLDGNGDGATDAVHHWSLNDDNAGTLELSVDSNADDTVDAVVHIALAGLMGTALQGRVDFDADGTAETAVFDGGGDWGAADLVIDRIDFTGNQTLALTEAHARLLSGVREVRMAPDGNTDISISIEALMLLADGNRDGLVDRGYTLTVEADVGDLLAIPQLPVSRDSSQDTATHFAFTLLGATLLLDRDVTFAVGEGDWREMALLRQLPVLGADQRNSGWLLEAYGTLYGAEALASLRDSPSTVEADHVTWIQGMVPLVNAYLGSAYQGRETTFGTDTNNDGTPDASEVVVSLDRDDDGMAEAVHTWTLDDTEPGKIEIAVDVDVDGTADQMLIVPLGSQTGPLLAMEMDWSGNGTNDAMLTDGSATSPGDLVLDSMSLGEDLQLALTDAQASFLAGIQEIQMDGDSTSGTMLTITDAQLTLLADGNGDGRPDQNYALVLLGPAGSSFTPGIGIAAIDEDGTVGDDTDDHGRVIYRGTDGSILVDPEITIIALGG